MNNKRIVVWATIAVLVLFAACGPAGDSYEEAEEATPPPEASMDVPPFAVLISHKVADYDKWKKVFDEHMPARKAAGCLGHHLNRGADDPSMVHVYCPATDLDKIKAFMSSPDLAEAMKNAGVVGPPTITLMKPMTVNFIPGEKLAGIIISHAVEDYATWRVAYDAFDAYRVEHGIVGHAVNQVVGNPNQVVVYHQAKDIQTLRAFVDSAELEETMQRAGVVGPPVIRFVQAADYAEY